MTIDLGFAYTTLPDGTELGFVDVPGHERFLPNMLAGVLSIDRVLLIVAADDGPRPQTLEHLDILELIGIAEVTGVVTKIDRVPEPSAATRSRPSSRGCSPRRAAAIARSSRCRAVTGDGIAALAAHLRDGAAAAAAERAARPAAGGFRLPIDRVFSLPGIGLVVTGTAAAGAVAVGDRLLPQPARRRGPGARRPCPQPPGRAGPRRRALAPSTSPAASPRAASRGAATG